MGQHAPGVDCQFVEEPVLHGCKGEITASNGDPSFSEVDSEVMEDKRRSYVGMTT